MVAAVRPGHDRHRVRCAGPPAGARRAGGGRRPRAAARPPPSSLRGGRGDVAAGGRGVVRRRAAGRVRQRHLPRGHGRGVPARQRRRPGPGPRSAWPSSSAARPCSCSTTRRRGARRGGDPGDLRDRVGRGSALRNRPTQAVAAEERAAHAERERESAARIAVAEERVRVARELHDIVAHAVSVMVLQTGAVRHRLPDASAEDAEALRASSRPGARRSSRCAAWSARCAGPTSRPSSRPQPGLARLDALLEEVRRAGLPVDLHVDGEPFPLPAGDRPVRLPHRAGGADEHAQARRRRPGRRPHPLRAERAAHRGARRRRRQRAAATASGTGSSACASASRCTAARWRRRNADGGGFLLRTRLPLDGARR